MWNDVAAAGLMWNPPQWLCHAGCGCEEAPGMKLNASDGSALPRSPKSHQPSSSSSLQSGHMWPWILTKLAIYGHWTITSWGGELLSTLSISHLGGLHVGEPFFSAVGGLVHCGGFEAKKANDAEWA